MQRRSDSIIAVAALVVALAAAYAFDSITSTLAQQAARTFVVWPRLWVPVLLNLLLAAGLVILVGWLAVRAAYPPAIDLLYVIVGLAALLYLPLDITLRVGWPMFPLLGTGTANFWNTTGAVLALAGLFHLVWRRLIGKG